MVFFLQKDLTLFLEGGSGGLQPVGWGEVLDGVGAEVCVAPRPGVNGGRSCMSEMRLGVLCVVTQLSSSESFSTLTSSFLWMKLSINTDRTPMVLTFFPTYQSYWNKFMCYSKQYSRTDCIMNFVSFFVSCFSIKIICKDFIMLQRKIYMQSSGVEHRGCF